MRRLPLVFVVVGLMGAAGCAHKGGRTPGNALTGPITPKRSTTNPADTPLAELPRPMMPKAKPSTNPFGEAPLEALALYARARDTMLQGQRYTAITVLEKAIALDPESYELRYALGQAYAGVGTVNEQSIKAYEAAAALDPNHLDLQTELGRQYLAKTGENAKKINSAAAGALKKSATMPAATQPGDETVEAMSVIREDPYLKKALEHLMLALETTEYQRDDPLGVVTDFFLGRALQHRGYEQAAIDSYEHLLNRLKHGGLAARSNVDLATLAGQAESVAAILGELYDRRKEYDRALASWEFYVERRPEALEGYARVVRTLLLSGRQQEAARRATEVVQRFRASNDSIALLKEAYREAGGDAAVAEQLASLHRREPEDRAVLFALVDTLNGLNRRDESRRVLENAAPRSNYDSEIVRRLSKIYDANNDTEAAARLLVEALAHRPDAIRDLGEMWGSLIRSSRRNRLTLTQLREMKVPAEAESSRLLWVSRMAQIWSRDALARSTLEQSAKIMPPFAPTYRVLTVEYATRSEWDPAKRAREVEELISSVRRQGNEALAAELEGLALIATGKPADAAKKFDRALKLGDHSMDCRLAYSNALRAAGNTTAGEKALWDLLHDEPECEDAYAALFRQYIDAHSFRQADGVLHQWLDNMPNSVNARLLQTAVMIQTGQQREAENMLMKLFAEQPDSIDVLQTLAQYYQRVGRTEEYIAKLEAERAAHPENRMAAEQLVTIYAERKQLPDAMRVLEAARKAAGNDPDLLYYVGALHNRIGDSKTNEQILQQIIEMSPDYAPANNDLGYNWADRGVNMARAESLIRNAVKAEPDNQSYLDSLGWVLYKRAKFGEARQFLEQAIAPATLPDPVVLDHLADTLYRLGNKPEALKRWKQSQDRLNQTESDRPDLKELRLQLQSKLKQAEGNLPVKVAPTAEGVSATPQQAKS